MAQSRFFKHGHVSRHKEEAVTGSSIVQELVELDDELHWLEQQCREACLEVDQRYAPRYADLAAKRKLTLASGGDASPDAEPKGTVPGFWTIALLNSEEFQEDIEEYDEPVLNHLVDIIAVPLQEDTGFKLHFLFAPNPYFSDRELVKTYHTRQKNAFMQKVQCFRVEAPDIRWGIGKNVTVEIKARRRGRAKREEVSRPSFFRTFFRDLGEGQELPEEELDEEPDEEAIDDIMDCLVCEDYQRGVALRDHIVPRAVRWYTGDACEDTGEDEEEDEEEDEVRLSEGVGRTRMAEHRKDEPSDCRDQ